MKGILTIGFLLFSLRVGFSQEIKGRVIVEHINAPSLQNAGGEDPVRRITIYLPPGYDKTNDRYPVIYYLHGFTSNDSLEMAGHQESIFDKAITEGKIKPVIVVMPDQYTLFKGSFYTNSTLTGRWSDFTAHDLVEFIDGHYRTITDRRSRGITGHSMGGHGALKVSMQFPEVFSAVYALSPAVLTLARELGPEGDVFRIAGELKSRDELFETFTPLAVVAMGRAFSPNPAKPPFFCDLPFTYPGGRLQVNQPVLELWHKNLPVYMIDQYAANLGKLTAIKLDWGRNEDFPHIPIGCMMFSQKLENIGIKHYAEEYIGNHGNMVWATDGRVLHEVLPFFNEFLSFPASPPAIHPGKKR